MDMPVALVSRERSRSASSSIRIVRIPIFLPPWIQAWICITIHITRLRCCQVKDDFLFLTARAHRSLAQRGIDPAPEGPTRPNSPNTHTQNFSLLMGSQKVDFYFFCPPVNPPSSAPSDVRSVWIASGSGMGIFRKARPLTSSGNLS